MISSITASYCKCCDFVFKTSDIDRHCKSKRHYNLFVKQLVADAKVFIYFYVFYFYLYFFYLLNNYYFLGFKENE